MIGRRMVATTAVIAAVAAGGVAGAILGIPGSSGASTASPSASTSTSMPGKGAGPHFHGGRGGFGPAIGADKDVIAAAAAALKLSTQDLLSKLSDGKTTIADVATQQNVKLSDVVAAMQKVADSDISNLVNNPFPAPPSFKGGPNFKGGPASPNGVGPAIGFGFGFGGPDSFGTIAKALGLTTQQLMTDMRNGQSIAAIAKTKNVVVDNLITTLVNDATSKITAAVKAGHLSQDQATKIEGTLKDMFTNLVNNTGPKGFGHFGGFGRHGRFGPGGPGGPGGPKGSASSSTTMPVA